MIYLTIKALHVISVISWMAGMLYLPRLFAYHADANPGGEASETFKVMEWRLYRYIIAPAMLATWLFGLILVYLNGFGVMFSTVWFPAKFALVLLLSAYHGWLGGHRRAFAEDRNEKSARFFRIANEVPTLLMIAIVLLVILRPW